MSKSESYIQSIYKRAAEALGRHKSYRLTLTEVARENGSSREIIQIFNKKETVVQLLEVVTLNNIVSETSLYDGSGYELMNSKLYGTAHVAHCFLSIIKAKNWATKDSFIRPKHIERMKVLMHEPD